MFPGEEIKGSRKDGPELNRQKLSFIESFKIYSWVLGVKRTLIALVVQKHKRVEVAKQWKGSSAKLTSAEFWFDVTLAPGARACTDLAVATSALTAAVGLARAVPFIWLKEESDTAMDPSCRPSRGTESTCTLCWQQL